MHVTYVFNEGFVKGALGINSIISRSYYAYNSPPIYKIVISTSRIKFLIKMMSLVIMMNSQTNSLMNLF